MNKLKALIVFTIIIFVNLGAKDALSEDRAEKYDANEAKIVEWWKGYGANPEFEDPYGLEDQLKKDLIEKKIAQLKVHKEYIDKHGDEILELYKNQTEIVGGWAIVEDDPEQYKKLEKRMAEHLKADARWTDTQIELQEFFLKNHKKIKVKGDDFVLEDEKMDDEFDAILEKLIVDSVSRSKTHKALGEIIN